MRLARVTFVDFQKTCSFVVYSCSVWNINTAKVNNPGIRPLLFKLMLVGRRHRDTVPSGIIHHNKNFRMHEFDS